jgi:hypothetical protein
MLTVSCEVKSRPKADLCVQVRGFAELLQSSFMETLR